MRVHPFVHHPDTPEQLHRRLLLISYHFPPDATVGARRWEKLARFVAERGWGLDVITCEPQPGADLARLDALPAGVRVYGLPPAALPIDRMEYEVWRVYRALRERRNGAGGTEGEREALGSEGAKFAGSSRRRADRRPDTFHRSEVRWRLGSLRGLFRAYWAWGDFARHGGWARRAAALAGRIIQPGVHIAVVTSGPPHMIHTCGALLATRERLPFVMDMRDPWGLSERLPEPLATPLWLRLAARYERRAIARAALVVANTEQAGAALAAAYPDARGRIITVMNGSDDDEPIPASRHGGRFTIGYAGTVYLERDPRSLFRAAARVVRELALTPEDFGIAFIGAEAPGEPSLDDLAREEGIAEFVSTGPARPHAEALQFLAEATMLVTFPGLNTMTIPAKVFECVRFDAWLLALSDPGSPTDVLLRGTTADVVPPNDIAAIASVIRRRYEEHRRGVTPVRVARDDRFSRRTQARILLDAIARLIPQEEAARARSALATRS